MKDFDEIFANLSYNNRWKCRLHFRLSWILYVSLFTSSYVKVYFIMCSESILVSFCRNQDLRPRFMLRGGMLSNIYVLVMGLFTIALT